MIEIWKDIPGYEKFYQVSNLGNVRSKDRLVVIDNYENHHATCKGFSYIKPGKIMKQHTNKFGYYTISLVDENKIGKGYMVHRLVAMAFIENPNNLPFINHKDENKENNNVDNLEWCTSEYNTNYGSCLKRRSEKQRYTNKNMKSVYAIDEKGNFLDFISIRDAARTLKLNQSNIQKALKENNKCGGFYWKLKEGGNYVA